MSKYMDLKKCIIAISTALAVLAAAGPAAARWDELINPETHYAGPPVQEEQEEVASLQGIYRVKQGDTLSGIADRFGFSASRLANLNKLSDRDRIYEGQVLRLPANVLTHRVEKGETLSEISTRYNVDLDVIARCNNITNSDMVFAGKQITIPVGSKQPVRAVTAGSLSVGQLPWPVTGWVSSPFGMRDGRMHEGIDIAAGTGEPIIAVRGGKVIFAGTQDGYGLTVIIDHGNGFSTLYAHCSELLVKTGERVASGQLIARVGSTGRSTGPHLHLEVRLDGVPHDPMTYLQRVYA